jgi:hypothetical protein
MGDTSVPRDPPNTGARRHRRLRLLVGVVAVWAITAYLLIPWIAKRYYSRLGEVSAIARLTVTGDDHPGDPVNIALGGTDEQVVHAMTAAGWHPADPLTFRTSVRIVVDSVLRRPDPDAPVSNLFLFGRRQDLAFEQPVGDSPRQVTHHIGPDVDAERDRIMSELQQAGWAERAYYIDGFHTQLEGRNGGDDRWRTDGRLGAVVPREAAGTATGGSGAGK